MLTQSDLIENIKQYVYQLSHSELDYTLFCRQKTSFNNTMQSCRNSFLRGTQGNKYSYDQNKYKINEAQGEFTWAVFIIDRSSPNKQGEISDWH